MIRKTFVKQFYIGLIESWSKRDLQKSIFYFGHDEMIAFQSNQYFQLNETAKLQGIILLICMEMQDIIKVTNKHSRIELFI